MGFDVQQVLGSRGTDTSMVSQILFALTVVLLVFKLVRDNNAVWATLD